MATRGQSSWVMRSKRLQLSGLAGTGGVAPASTALQPAVERTDEPARPRDGKVVEPAIADLPEPPTNFPDAVVPALAEHLLDARQGPVDPFGNRFATKPKASSQGCPAIVREAQKVESLRLAHPR